MCGIVDRDTRVDWYWAGTGFGPDWPLGGHACRGGPVDFRCGALALGSWSRQRGAHARGKFCSIAYRFHPFWGRHRRLVSSIAMLNAAESDS